MNRFRAVRKGTMYSSRNNHDDEELFKDVGCGTMIVAPFIILFGILAWHITIPACIVAYFVIKHIESKKGEE